MSLSEATTASGFFNRDQITERYAQRTGLDVSELAWYQVLAYWKSSVFLEDMYTRWNAGERPGDDYAPRMADGIPELLEAAQALTR
jgi:aminoglycoside phosphotransferase (APT) family kinase protein